MSDTCAVCGRIDCRPDSVMAARNCLRLGYERATGLLGEARAWMDKHRCCTEERRALIARIDAILSPRAAAPRET